MQIHLSFDYELFFGSESGTVDNCMIKPTTQLMDLAKKHNIPLIFFVDAGYLCQLKKHLSEPLCLIDFNKISTQLKQLVESGHEIALHVHPHWEDCKFENGKWVLNTERYKLGDFSESEVNQIITNYHQTLIDIIGKPCHSFRAGGWCVQPFSHIKKALMGNSIFRDSSVYFNGYHDSSAHSYDFKKAPDKSDWRFESDCCIEDFNGSFNEIAITSDKIDPVFYLELYFKMRSNPKVFKPIGDGNWLKDKKRIYKQFYSSTNHFACADGYFASRLISILKKQQRKNQNRMMVLSHPKSLAACSFGYLNMFISYAKNQKHTFTTLKT